PGVACGSMHAVVHAPQCIGSLPVSVQLPLQHESPIAHGFPQRPQLSTSSSTFEQTELQHIEPAPHGCTSLQPGTHVPMRQMVPGEQSPSLVQPVHMCDPRSHTVGGMQSALVRQPGTQWCVESQSMPAAHVSVGVLRHETHVPVGTSQKCPRG